MDNKMEIVYSEVYFILNHLDEKAKNKLPTQFMEYIKKNKEDGFIPDIDLDIPLKYQNLKKETKNLLAGLYLKFWCEDEYEKNELIDIFKCNDELEKKEYKYEDLFNPVNIEKEAVEEKKPNFYMVKYKKDNIFKRIINIVKRLFFK